MKGAVPDKKKLRVMITAVLRRSDATHGVRGCFENLAGRKRAPNTDTWSWEDGTPWDKPAVFKPALDVGTKTDTCLEMAWDGPPLEIVWKDQGNDDKWGMFCQAASLSAIKSAAPGVVHLGGPRSILSLAKKYAANDAKA